MNPLLELKSIKKSFGENHIHKGIDLKVNKGENIALLGGSGTGKSVLLRSIIGLERVDQGQIFFSNQSIERMSESDYVSIRKKISYAFQSGALFDSLSVYENLAFPLREHTNDSEEEIQKKIQHYLSLVDLAGKEFLMPSDLSGGMQKRVGMARAMILGPEMILFDEPTAGLDPFNARNIVQILHRFIERGMTSIFVTHDIPVAVELCSRVCILAEGKIAFDRPTKDFLETDNDITQPFKMFL